jgi:hypothetical protein
LAPLRLQQVTFIMLGEGFHALPGVYFFEAQPDPCSYTYWKESADDSQTAVQSETVKGNGK